MPTRSWQDLLNDAGDGGGTYDPLPEGDYDFTVVESEVKTASTGRTMYAVKTAVEGGLHNGRFVWHNFVVTPESPTALGWFFKNMNVLGLGREYFATDPADHQVAAALKGRRFRGQVAIRKWQGQDRNEIKAFFPPAGSGLGAPPASAAPAHAAPPPAAAPAPPPPPPAAPAPPPVAQAPAPAPQAESPAEQVQAAPVAPPPPPPPAAEAAAPPPPPAAPEPAMAGAAAGAGSDAPPPPPFD